MFVLLGGHPVDSNLLPLPRLVDSLALIDVALGLVSGASDAVQVVLSDLERCQSAQLLTVVMPSMVWVP
jgi:hypothetical protein